MNATVLSNYVQLLGTVQVDRVTGFEGMVSHVGFDAYGCVQIILTPTTMGKDGELPKGQWFDVNRLAPNGSPRRLMEVPQLFAQLPEEPRQFAHGPADKPDAPNKPMPGV